MGKQFAATSKFSQLDHAFQRTDHTEEMDVFAC